LNFPIVNKRLLDLLGTRFLLQPSDPSLAPKGESEVGHDLRWNKVAEDRHPRTFLQYDGLKDLAPYSIYENRSVFPRAFVVPGAARLPDREHVLEALKSNDFHRRVLLEDDGRGPLPADGEGDFRPALIRSYLPNRVTVEVDGASSGYLVLTDVWYPGWTCTVDGWQARLFRGDFLFRAVAVPAGSHTVVFTFAPASYFWGKRITTGGITVLFAITLLAAVKALYSRIAVMAEISDAPES
jgi:hypothetical protein